MWQLTNRSQQPACSQLFADMHMFVTGVCSLGEDVRQVRQSTKCEIPLMNILNSFIKDSCNNFSCWRDVDMPTSGTQFPR